MLEAGPLRPSNDAKLKVLDGGGEAATGTFLLSGSGAELAREMAGRCL